MENEPLHIKYRPKNLDSFVGNNVMLRSLQDVLSKKSRPHSFLFYGPSGCGKTTLARILATELGCSARDFHEMNSANYRGIDSIRELINKASLRPWEGEVVVYLLDEAHMLTKDAQNAVLKLLEEPPAHCYFALCTTDPEKLLKTIHTRCAQFGVTALGRRHIVDHLKKVYSTETKLDPAPDLIQAITRASNGSMRAALIILDQVIDIDDIDEAIDAVHEAAGSEKLVIDLCRALAKNPEWVEIAKMLSNLQGEPETTRYAVLGYFNSVALKAKDPWAALVCIKHFSQSFMYSGKAGLTMACWKATEEIKQ